MKSEVHRSGAPFIVSLPNDKSRKDSLMKRRKLLALSAVILMVVAVLLISSQTVLVSAQGKGAGGQKGDRDVPPPVYNPYPPGILPADLDSEIARVLREIDVTKVELLKGGTPYRRRHDWRSARARIRPSLRIPELNQSKHSANLCFSTRTCRPAEIKRARLATCRMLAGADRSRP